MLLAKRAFPRLSRRQEAPDLLALQRAVAAPRERERPLERDNERDQRERKRVECFRERHRERPERERERDLYRETTRGTSETERNTGDQREKLSRFRADGFGLRVDDLRGGRRPLSSELGTDKSVSARFLPWLSGKSSQNVSGCSPPDR